MSIFVALLRGINVGGKHLLPMADLRAVCEGLGWSRVVTHIQSGNVVFYAHGAEADLASSLAHALETRLGFRVPVIVRPGASLTGTLAANPFAIAGEDASLCFVALLSSAPSPERVEKLDPTRSPPDRFIVVGSDVFLHLPNGAARTKLTVDWLERQLGGVATIRNLRTLAALADLAVTQPT
ncbi:hypothetical protein LBMAG42_31500 [Deltaproteobacteria bacterium]|nr:hypothetical protein LBMAG42_31500 [Deltaproteobacteria bacterium]